MPSARSIVSAAVPEGAKRALDSFRSRRTMAAIAPANEEFVRRYGLEVTGGPFRGMRYLPGEESRQGDLITKLLGLYEASLRGPVQEWLERELQVIVNVGCAEGYYAVGLARRLPGVRIHAYDIDPEARRLCTELAARNEVSERVTVEGECTTDTLRSFPKEGVAVLCDCEGCELALLDPALVPQLTRWWLIVELHDFVDPTITATIRSRFAHSHDIRLLHSDPLPPALPELEFLDHRRRSLVLSERRPAQMCWAVMKPRSSRDALPRAGA